MEAALAYADYIEYYLDKHHYKAEAGVDVAHGEPSHKIVAVAGKRFGALTDTNARKY